MIVLEDFRGWDIAALWEDLKFDARHSGDFGRIAVLGDSTLEEWGPALSKPFLGSELRSFDINERPASRAWRSEGRSPPPATYPATKEGGSRTARTDAPRVGIECVR